MTIEIEDPRLTAYAIGELEPAERAEVEAALENSPEAKSEMEAIRVTASLLEQEFGQVTPIELSDQQREQVIAAGSPPAEGKVVRPDGFSRTSRWLGITAAAACVLAVGTIGVKQALFSDKPEMKSESIAPRGESEIAVEAEEAADEIVAGKSDVLKGAVGGGQPAKLRKGGKAGAFGRAEPLATEMPGEIASAGEGSTAPAGNPDLAADSTPPPGMPRVPSEDRAAPITAGADPAPAIDAPRSEFAATRRDGMAALNSVEKKQFQQPSAPADMAARSRGSVDSVGAAPPKLSAPAPPMAPVAEPELRFMAGAAKPAARRAMAKTKSTVADAGFADDAQLLGGRVGREFDADKRAKEEGEDYGRLYDTPFFEAFERPLSTFSIDVDTASYSNMRRFIARRGQLPPKDSVRVEEMINYFDYDYPTPQGEHPFGVHLEVASCPWEKGHRLVKVGLKGKDMQADKRPPSNLVFLVDSSGSMRNQEKLPLLKTSLAALTRHLNEDDRISIVTYSGGAGVALDPVHGDQKEKIIDALDALKAGGSTNGAGGIELAYKLAAENYVEGGTNRVILATDGDFNVGTTNTDQLVEMVKARADKDKIFLTVLGFGEGNLKEARMEQIANKGNGNYFYIDSALEGKRVLVDKLSSTLVTIAKDVKIQVDFNPAKVHSYRLIGYANRRMAAKDFRDDTKDAGEIGAGHTVTALYQVVPAEAVESGKVAADASVGSRYRKAADADAKAELLVDSEEMLTVALRYKQPEGDTATEFSVPLTDPGKGWEEAGDDFRFASAVAGFGMLLRESEFAGLLNYDLVLELAEEGRGEDENALRKEFIELATKAKAIAGK